MRQSNLFLVVAGSILLVCLGGAARVSGQSAVPDWNWEKAAGGRMSFDFAFIKEDNSDRSTSTNFPLGLREAFRPTQGLFSVKNLHVDRLITFAYKLTPSEEQALSSQLPRWALTNRYDIEGRAKDNPTKDQFRLMVQSLLAERFKLALRLKQRQVSANEPNRAVILDHIEEPSPN